MPKLTPLLMGPGDYALYFDLGMLNIFFTNWNSIPFMLMRLDHKPWLFTTFMIARVIIQVSLACCWWSCSSGASTACSSGLSSRRS